MTPDRPRGEIHGDATEGERDDHRDSHRMAWCQEGPRTADAGGGVTVGPVGIVTGASRGLGLALTRALAERGWRLVVDARGAEALERAVAPLEGVVAIPGDVADPGHRRALVEAAGERIELL